MNLCRFLSFVYICIAIGDPIAKWGRVGITFNQFNAVPFLCLSVCSFLKYFYCLYISVSPLKIQLLRIRGGGLSLLDPIVKNMRERFESLRSNC